jgi:septal ring factor EnvC (AmiA/AmiB activator)
MGARGFIAWHYNKMRSKAEVKRLNIKVFLCMAIFAVLSLFPSPVVFADDDPAPLQEAAQTAPKSELDNLKAEWEAVREQQIQMIREKEDQLEKLKEEIFAKMKTLNAPAAPASVVPQPAPSNPAEFEAQKASLQAERQKFFAEMSRQKESLRKLQAALDEKTKQLEADRASFEQEKKTAVR